ncbi:MAG: NADH-quinone oxidoreductase subunit I [Chloroflexi bacterium]|nr:NADH-quinone oxidoreductase subunit I [Chloroflexota bacterium]
MADAKKPLGQGILKGLALTLKHFLARPIITVQYPEQTLVHSRRLRGCDLVWDPERCTACCTCAKSCPQGNIRIETRLRPDNTREAVVFEIDHGRTMFCGLCVESCPFDAIHMGKASERATYSRESLVLPKEKLTISPERQPSGYFRPQFEAELPPQTLLVYGGRASEGPAAPAAPAGPPAPAGATPPAAGAPKEKVGVK